MQINPFRTDVPRDPFSDVSVPENSLCRVMLRNGVWLLGILTWLFGVFDRGYVTFANGEITFAHVTQLLTAVFLFWGWLYLKPEDRIRGDQSVVFQDYSAALTWQKTDHISMTKVRMLELQKHHVISREYVLPFPYLCQVYHLLNLKHLETIHGFSLNNLKVLAVSDFQPTDVGGKLRFQTILASPLNILRVWRQKTVEVELTLHNPFTVELQIPVRDGKTINVMFTVMPLDEQEHRFYVDIYSNLPWPKPLLRFMLEFATSLTLLEDLPYLRQLAARKQPSLTGSRSHSDREQNAADTMQLYRRYVSLYSST